MTYGELKQTEEYLNATDIDLCINGEDPIDEQYYPEEFVNMLELTQTCKPIIAANGKPIKDKVSIIDFSR